VTNAYDFRGVLLWNVYFHAFQNIRGYCHLSVSKKVLNIGRLVFAVLEQCVESRDGTSTRRFQGNPTSQPIFLNLTTNASHSTLSPRVTVHVMIPTRPGSSLGERRRSISGNAPGRTSLSGRTSFGASGGNANPRVSIGTGGAGGGTSIGGSVAGSGIPRASMQSRVRNPSFTKGGLQTSKIADVHARFLPCARQIRSRSTIS
jgi:hypothetical protein